MSLELRRLKEEAEKAGKGPKNRAELLALRPELDYGKGRTKQSFKDATDINKILHKAQKVGSLSHLQKHGAYYGDFANAPQDMFEAREMLQRGQEIFNEAPAEVRAEFNHDPLKFFQFANDPANAGRLEELLPAIAEPGRYFPQVSGSAASGQPQAIVTGKPSADRD